SRRTLVSADHAKRASLLSLCGADFYRDSRHRCLESALVCRSRERANFVWHRRGYNCARGQRGVARRLCVRLSLVAPLDRRISRSIFKIGILLSCLRVCELLQPPPHAVGVDELVLGWFLRSI